MGNVGYWEDPFAYAVRRAGPRASCPVNELEELYADHWDHDALCSVFGCAECVATPEDFGWPDWMEPVVRRAERRSAPS